jgi:DNA-binding response OmpR family regulator
MVGKKILVVDFDSQSLEAMIQLLKPYKFQLSRAVDGQEAYDKFKEERPDLVVMEAILPKLHGFELTERITHETKGHTPVIIVTGAYRGPQYRHEALTTFGASDYFEKPLDKEKFINSVLGLLKEESEIWLDLPAPDDIASYLAKKAGLAAKAGKQA